MRVVHAELGTIVDAIDQRILRLNSLALAIISDAQASHYHESHGRVCKAVSQLIIVREQIKNLMFEESNTTHETSDRIAVGFENIMGFCDGDASN